MKKKCITKFLAITMAGLMSVGSMPLNIAFADEYLVPYEEAQEGTSRETLVTWDNDGSDTSEGYNATVLIPKNVALDKQTKTADYDVTVKGRIRFNEKVTVVPRDEIDSVNGTNFYMKDTGSLSGFEKADVPATVVQNDTAWSVDEVTEDGTAKSGNISAPGLTFGSWSGNVTFDINLEPTDGTHTHNFVDGMCTKCGIFENEDITNPGGGSEETPDPSEHTHSYTETVTKEASCTEAGEKTYTCDCGDSYTEVIPAKGHSYGEDDKCVNCGTLASNHTHSYTETVTKEATCTEAGSKDLECRCGDSKTEVIPALEHNYVDDICDVCGDVDPNHSHNYVDGTCTICGEIDTYEIAPEFALDDWDYTLDETNKIVTLNKYTGSGTDVIVYSNYVYDGVSYKTKLNDDSSKIFNGKNSINTIKFSNYLDTSNVTNMKMMFYNCSKLTELDLSNFDTSKVTDMSYMFYNCASLTVLDLSSINTSKVTDMSKMFDRCELLTKLNLSSFDTSNVTLMSGMFDGCSSLTELNLSNFDTSKVRNMNSMFRECSKFTALDLSNFNTSKVTDMNYMFYLCSSLTELDVSSFVTSSVTNMNNMFGNCSSLSKLDVSSFKTYNVTNMSSMFYNCKQITELDLSSFKTSKATDMNSMFSFCENLKTLYVSEDSWITSQANTNNMFERCWASITFK